MCPSTERARALLLTAFLSSAYGCASNGSPAQAPEPHEAATAAIVEREGEIESPARGEAIEPPVPASKLRGNILHRLDRASLPPELESIRAVAREGDALHLFGCDVQGKRCRRITVRKTGSTHVDNLPGIAQVQGETLTKCGDVTYSARYKLGTGNVWELVKLDSRLQQTGVANIPAVSDTNSVIPLMASDGMLLWVLWSTSSQTTLQLFRDDTHVATHRLGPPPSGWPDDLDMALSHVAHDGKLHLLRGGEKGLEAILVDETGELRRDQLAKGLIESHAIARVGDRFFAVWREPNGQRGLYRQTSGLVKAQWLSSIL